MNLSKRDQILLMVMVIILALFVFVKFSYLPGREEIQSLTTTQQELQKQKQDLQQITAQKTTAQNEAEKEFADLDKRLPSNDELVPLMNVLNDSCKKYKVPMTSLEYRGAEEKNPAGAQTMVFTIGTKGKVSQLFDFLNTLETNQRLISVLDVSLDAVKAEAKTSTETTNEIPTYYIAPPGMPEAKLQRVKFEVENAQETASAAEKPVASGLVPDSFEMRITINAYYAGQTVGVEPVKETGKDVKGTANSQNAKGEV